MGDARAIRLAGNSSKSPGGRDSHRAEGPQDERPLSIHCGH